MNSLTIDVEENEILDGVQVAEAVYKTLAQSAALYAEVTFVGDDEIQRLNREFRQIDKVTDVLSFPTLDGVRGKVIKKKDFPFDVDENGAVCLGSIAVCIKRAKEQADEYGHSLKREVNYLTVHGLLHLFGYDHMTETDKTEMRDKEEKIMNYMNITREV